MVEAAQQALVEDLGRPVEGPVVVGVVRFRGGELLGHAVDRGGGGGDDLLHLVLDAELQQVEGGVGHDLHGQSRVLGALGDAQGRHVEDQVRVADQLLHEGAVADVGLDQADLGGGHGVGQVLRAAALHVVDGDDLGAAFLDQEVDDVGADESGAAGDQDPFAFEIHISP